MTKRNRLMSIGLIVLVLAIVTSCVAGYSFAKYTTTATYTSTSNEVALWNWEVNGDVASSFTFDLFDSVKEEDGLNTEDDVDGNLIAPGTGGKFTIAIENLSEVNGTYAIAFTETNANSIPIQYSLNGTSYGAISSIQIAATNIAMETGVATVTVYWKWAFTGDDAADTALGQAGEAKVSVKADATFTQAD